MKKTLFILSLATMPFVTMGEDITGTVTIGNQVYKSYSDLNLTGSIIHTTDWWANLHITNLTGNGTIQFHRGESSSGAGNNCNLVWLDGVCSEFSGTVSVSSPGNAKTLAAGLILGNENDAVSLAKASVNMGAAGSTVLALVNNATIATEGSATFTMKGGEIRHIATPSRFSGAIANDTGLPAVTDSTVTLTLGKATLNGTTLQTGVKTVINGNADITGLTVNEALELNGSVNTVSGSVNTAVNKTLTLGNDSTTTVTGTINANKSLGSVGNLTMNGGTLSLDENAVAQFNSLTLKNGATVNLSQGSTFAFRTGGSNVNFNGIYITSLNDTETASVSGDGTNGIFERSADGYTVSNAQVTMNGVGQSFAYSTALYQNAAVRLNGGATAADDAKVFEFRNADSTFVSLEAHGQSIQVNNGAASTSTLKNIAATGGDITIYSLGTGAALNRLTLSNGKNVSFYSSANTDTEATINITEQLNVTHGGSTLEANLVMNSGTMTFADGAVLTMGCDVTIGDTVTVVLTDAMVQSIMAGNYVEIFDSVENSNLSQSLTFIGSGTMSDYVTEHQAVYALKQVGDKIYITPEPATATLSLLALAALAARRKRH